MDAGPITVRRPRPPWHPGAGTSVTTAAAVGAAGICTSFAGLQLALAAGAPLGEHVWGGTQERVLSPRMRLASAGAVVVLGAMGSVIVRQAGLVGRPARWLAPATWAIAGCLALNTVGNVASSSPVERWVFGPATAAAAGLTATVAAGTRSGGSVR